jgi:Ca-activated chloride channel family protein
VVVVTVALQVAADETTPPPPAPPPVEAAPKDPWSAFAAGRFDRALEGFLDRQVERPDDAAGLRNIAAARYRLGDFAGAAEALAAAVDKAGADDALRERSLYDLGNARYRQGQLEESAKSYEAALAIDPEDEDARYNLEFVREEIRRRLEEAAKREHQQQQPQQQDQQEQQQEQEQEQQPQPDPEQQGSSGQDQDGDGLSDQQERSAANPTDPTKADSDGDGLADGEEDANRDGQVSPGETNPNDPDSDDDGTPDGAEGGRRAGDGQPGGEMSPEEVEAALRSLEEGRPAQTAPPQPARRTRPAKDW